MTGRAPQQDGFSGVSGGYGTRHWEPQQCGSYQGGHAGDNRWDVGRGNQQWTGYSTGGVSSGIGTQQQRNQDEPYSDGGHWDEVKECIDPTDWTKPLPRNEKLEQ